MPRTQLTEKEKSNIRVVAEARGFTIIFTKDKVIYVKNGEETVFENGAFIMEE